MHGKDLSPHLVLHQFRHSVTDQTIFVVVVVVVVVVVLLLHHFLNYRLPCSKMLSSPEDIIVLPLHIRNPKRIFCVHCQLSMQKLRSFRKASNATWLVETKH
jgi:hypothetical protein